MTNFQAVIDAGYTLFGKPASYRAQDRGETVPCTVIREAPDAIDALGESRIRRETTVLKVRVVEIAAPEVGDSFALGAEVFIVQGKPERRDGERLEWTIDTYPKP